MKEFELSNYARFVRQVPFSFSRQSSIGCGGRAKAAFYPQNIVELKNLLSQLTKDCIPYIVLGCLTNVLPSDEDFDGVIVCTRRLNGITVGENVFALAGETSGSLLSAAKKENRTGGEFLNGIPCTLGGALYMNAGAGGRYISELVENVLVLRKGEELFLPVGECGYAYKKSVFMENDDIILGASLRMSEGSQAEIEEKTSWYVARRAHLPKGRSMGCVFKNPEGGFAGELVERSGLKGFRIGGAKISEEHANFIVNDGGATSREIRALIALAKNAVRAQYGVSLEEEIRYL